MSFDDVRVHVRLKLFALWSSAMFFYIYGDYFQLWQPGHLQGMLAGQLFFPGSPQWVLLGGASVMIIPSLMPFFALVLPVRLNRWLNIIFGVVYSLIMLAVIVASKAGWYFYTMYAVIEIILTLLIVWSAWTWPKQAGDQLK